MHYWQKWDVKEKGWEGADGGGGGGCNGVGMQRGEDGKVQMGGWGDKGVWKQSRADWLGGGGEVGIRDSKAVEEAGVGGDEN